MATIDGFPISSRFGRDEVFVPVCTLELSNPIGNRSADGLGMILLKKVHAGAEFNELAIMKCCSEARGEGGRYKCARIC